MAACGGDEGESTGITAENLTCPPGNTLTFANFGQAFLQDNCLSCHAAQESPRLSDAASVTRNKADILEAAVFTTFMPEGLSLSVEERRMFGEWIECGAP